MGLGRVHVKDVVESFFVKFSGGSVCFGVRTMFSLSMVTLVCVLDSYHETYPMHILHFHPEEHVWKETTPSYITNNNQSQKIQPTQTIEILRKRAVNHNDGEER